MAQKWKSICMTAQSALAMHLTFVAIAHLWISSSIFPTLLTIAGASFVWIVCGRIYRRWLGIPASAPTFVVVSLCFLWAVFVFLLRSDVRPAMDVAFNTQCFILIIGLSRMILSDPGYVRGENILSKSMDSSVTGSDQSNFVGHISVRDTNIQTNNDCKFSIRARYCRQCQAYINRFDHHCPAFGNCVGQQNHCFFILLLMAFITAESCYFLCGISWILSSENIWERQAKASHLAPWIFSTSLFAIVQVFWQVPFMVWHLYCISLNITTDEWVNWDKYPEFQLEIPPEPGRPFMGKKFKNPYNKGILRNIMSFLKSKP